MDDTRRKIGRVCCLCEALEEEVCYGFNFRSTLVEHATADVLEALEDLLRKARVARQQQELPLQ